MRKSRSPFCIAVALMLVLATLLLAPGPAQAAMAVGASGTSFRFVFAADSRDDYTVLPDFSHKMVTLGPVFGFFGGDLCGTLDTSCINNQWKPAMDGNNNDGMLAKTFVGRGNHDAGTLSTWQGLWDFSAMATRVGATQYTAETNDATYSFDYGNSHFAVVDNPDGGAAGWTSTQIAWLDNDLTAAENRGQVHEFLISHGPMYPATTIHASELPSSALKAVLNKHPHLIGLHGHEHVTAYTRVTPRFESGINDYPQFTIGRAGAPVHSVSRPVTWSADQNAFADVAVNGLTVIVTVYSQSGSVLYTRGFSHAAAAADFDGDGATDVSIFRPSDSTWYIHNIAKIAFGASGDIPVPADYDGDGKTDLAVFRASTGTWDIRTIETTVYGASGDIPIPADYNGDGRADIAVFRPSNGTWYIHTIEKTVYGTSGDIPVPADYDGDGQAEIAVFQPSSGIWDIAGMAAVVFGGSADIPVPADYNGDGRVDIAVFRPSNGTWYIHNIEKTVYGASDDIPVPADYDGDGQADIAVFRPSTGMWYIHTLLAAHYGAAGDFPLPARDTNGDGDPYR